jgi:GNAT superfamily N-acetyltransferase
LLDRGRAIFGSYAKVLLIEARPAAYAQFGPLSAYPRASQIREMYPRLPQSPLPAVITCVATSAADRGRGLGRQLVEAVTVDLATRGFSAVEAYPDLTLAEDEASAASPEFWERCGFSMAAADDRYPVMRLEFA